MVDGAGDVPGDGDETPIGVHDFEKFGRVGRTRRAAAARARGLHQLELMAMPNTLFFAPPDDELGTIRQQGFERRSAAGHAPLLHGRGEGFE